MSVKFRPYCMVTDFQKVYNLCLRCADVCRSNGMEASFWEYAQTFGSFKYQFSHRIGLWEDEGKTVAVATYEISLGEAYFVLDPDYAFLSEELIAYAERRLIDEEGRLVLCLTDTQTVLRQAAEKRGYRMKASHPEKIFRFEGGTPDFSLPEGFRFLKNDQEEIDYVKLDSCLHYGFNHEGEPDEDTDFRIHMHVTPHFNPQLPVIVVDEGTGAYAGYANAFIEGASSDICGEEDGAHPFGSEALPFAYLEPLCVQPQYRRMGIAAAIVSEMAKRVIPSGAKYMTGGSDEFYTKVGYTIAYQDEVWQKEQPCRD